MFTPTRPLSPFGHWLTPHLEEQNLSLRKLSRRLDAEKPEEQRRNLIRWIYGDNKPRRESVAAVAAALGVEPPEDETADQRRAARMEAELREQVIGIAQKVLA